MVAFQKILVPVDGSKNSMRGLNQAISIAKASNAEITGFYVFHLPYIAGIKYTQKMQKDADKKAVRALGPALQACEKAGA
ncbi:MAG: universal stress protein, partial [Nitrosopumilaceae archaeon]